MFQKNPQNSLTTWLKRYGDHVSAEHSQQLAAQLLAYSYPKTVWRLLNKQEYMFFTLTDFGKKGLRDKVVCMEANSDPKFIFEIESSFVVGSFPNTICLSCDRRHLAVACRGSDIVCVLKTADGKVEAIVDTGSSPTGLDFIDTGNGGVYEIFVTNFADDSVLCKRVLLNN